jgi:tripartite-type tricarboxylate transporter receptor subunit TctC
MDCSRQSGGLLSAASFLDSLSLPMGNCDRIAQFWQHEDAAMLTTRLQTLALAAFTACLWPSSSFAQDFYSGKTIRLVVGASATGGYNLYARSVARYMPKHIPGNPAIVVTNMPSGNGIAATNHVYNLAEKDGTVFGLFNRYTILLPLLGVEQAKYKPEEFNWLGTTASYSDNAYLFVIRAKLPQTDVASLRKANPPLNVGNVGAAPIEVINEALKLNLKIIHGYTGDNLDIAFENGEVDGHTTGYANMLARKAYWLEKGIARPMIQFGRETRHPDLPNVPTARELAETPEQLAMIKFVEAPLMIGYPFALPPGVPADRVAIMQKAFMDTMNDPEFKEDMLKQKLEYTPKDGKALAHLIAEMGKTPASVVKRYKELTGDRPGG